MALSLPGHGRMGGTWVLPQPGTWALATADPVGAHDSLAAVTDRQLPPGSGPAALLSCQLPLPCSTAAAAGAAAAAKTRRMAAGTGAAVPLWGRQRPPCALREADAVQVVSTWGLWQRARWHHTALSLTKREERGRQEDSLAPFG